MAKKDDDEKSKIIFFPELEARQQLQKQKKKEQQEKSKEDKKRSFMEEEYRSMYRAERAKSQSQSVRRSSQNPPLVNWDKIPPFTRYMLAIFLGVYLVLAVVVDDFYHDLVMYRFSFIPAVYTGGVEWHWSALFSPFTALVLHGNWLHLTFNLVMMAIMGVFFERQYGWKRTALFFILCGQFGNLLYFALNPLSAAPVVGASGAISGLFAAAFITMIERGMVRPDMQKRGPWPFIILWIAIIVGLGMISNDVAWQSHLGGFLGGVGLIYAWRKGYIKL
ncbi:MAG: rhomboid family intramembrane serine protease [Alphaproteobacteria bacterium]|nr:rhomboid family intramembrane serine protease [Alphaproteobacteria bacterium]